LYPALVFVTADFFGPWHILLHFYGELKYEQASDPPAFPAVYFAPDHPVSMGGGLDDIRPGDTSRGYYKGEQQ
jgi:hypothetical protein